MTDDREHEEIGREIHAMRAEPRPEFARELDERAAGWLREPGRRRLPSLRIALPAVAATAAAAVIAVAVTSGDGPTGGEGGGGAALEVAVVPEGEPGSGFAVPPADGRAEALGAPPQLDLAQPEARKNTQPGAGGGVFLLGEVEGKTVTVRYLFSDSAEATVELVDREAEVTVGPGAGSIEISTEGLPSGSHELKITSESAPTYEAPVTVR
ncbi:MAG TPA: hypothetical protein VD790_03985 [Thermoleophilaceae bacterium]|nr:hypothetical protein [Thermoleophilaceae bacterium]